MTNSIADVLGRAAHGLEIVDIHEQRAGAERHAELTGQAETRRMMADHDRHVGVASTGHDPAELARVQQDREAWRTERIAELEAELIRLDPNRRATAQRSQADIDAQRLLQRAREVGNSPFMKMQVVELERREQARRDELHRHQMARAEAELSRTGRY